MGEVQLPNSRDDAAGAHRGGRNADTMTRHIRSLLRRIRRRVDGWTLIAFNPPYPDPADR
jgi:hypothetical protein